MAPRSRAFRQASAPRPRPIRRLTPAWSTRSAASTASSSTPRSCTRRAAATCCATSYWASPALVHRAVGDRLTCIYVDHGLMRKRESELLRVTFEQNLGMRLVMVDARQRFLARLAGVEDPEEKRRIIGDAVIRVVEEGAARMG